MTSSLSALECPDCWHRWKYHGHLGSTMGCLAPGCRCTEPDPEQGDTPAEDSCSCELCSAATADALHEAQAATYDEGHA